MQFTKYLLKLVLLFLSVEDIFSFKSFLKNNEKIDPINNNIIYVSAFSNGIPQRILQFEDFLKDLKFNSKFEVLSMSNKKERNQILFEDPIEFNIEVYNPVSIRVFYPPMYYFNNLNDLNYNLLEVQINNKKVDDDSMMIQSLYFRRNISVTNDHSIINALKLIYKKNTDRMDINDKEIYTAIKNGMMRYAVLNSKIKWIGTVHPVDINNILFEEIASLSKNKVIHNKIVITERNSTLYHINNSQEIISNNNTLLFSYDKNDLKTEQQIDFKKISSFTRFMQRKTENITATQILINQLAKQLDIVAIKCKQLKNDLLSNNTNLNAESIAELVKICKESTPNTNDTSYFSKKFSQNSSIKIKNENITATQKLINQLAKQLDIIASKCKQLKHDQLSNSTNLNAESIAELVKICKESTPNTNDTSYFINKFQQNSTNIKRNTNNNKNNTETQKLINQLAKQLDNIANNCKQLTKDHLSKETNLNNDSIAELVKICKDTIPNTNDIQYYYKKYYQNKTDNNIINKTNSTTANNTTSPVNNSPNSVKSISSTNNNSNANNSTNNNVKPNNKLNISFSNSSKIINKSNNSENISKKKTNAILNNNTSDSKESKTNTNKNSSSKIGKDSGKSHKKTLHPPTKSNLFSSNKNGSFSVNHLDFKNLTAPRVYKNDVVTVENGIYKLNSILILG